MGRRSEFSREEKIAAVNQIQFVFQQAVFAIGSAMIVLGSQYWGQRRPGEIRSVAAIAVRLEILISAALFAAVSLFPQGAPRLFTDQPDFIAQGVQYLRIVRWTYLLFALSGVLLNMLRIAESVRIALVVSIVSLCVNILGNYLLIEGRLGFPAMGVRGAAISTLAARAIEFCIVVIYVLRERKIGMRVRHLFRWNPALAKDFFHVVMPFLFSQLLWGVSNAVQTVILGHMNDSAIAAQSISSTVFSLLKVMATGASSASAVLIGKTVGEGDSEKLKSYTRTLQIIFVGIGIILASAMLIIRYPLLSVYAPDISAETYRLAKIYMLIQAGVLLLMSYQMPVNSGIIRGGGDTKFILYLDIAGSVTLLPLAALGGLVWQWPAMAVIVCMNADQFLNAYRRSCTSIAIGGSKSSPTMKALPNRRQNNRRGCERTI